MKYVFLFCDSADSRRAFNDLPDDEKNRVYGEIGKWFEVNGSRILEGRELQGPETATTVRFNGSHEPLVTDGPFVESNETVGGFAVIEASDLDDALALARTWPGAGPLEVRPIVEY